MKSKPVEYHPAALLEAVAAYEWYEQREPGLGERLRIALQAGERFVARHPELGEPYDHGTRKWHVPHFPYKLAYFDLPDRVQVIAVIHDSRRPGYWHWRLSH